MAEEKRVFQLTTKELTDIVKEAVALGIHEYVKLLGALADVKSTDAKLKMQHTQSGSKTKPWNVCDTPLCEMPVKKGDILCEIHAKKIEPREYMQGKPKKRTVKFQEEKYLSKSAAHKKLESEGYRISLSYIYILVKNRKIDGYGENNLVDPEQVKPYCTYSKSSNTKENGNT